MIDVKITNCKDKYVPYILMEWILSSLNWFQACPDIQPLIQVIYISKSDTSIKAGCVQFTTVPLT